MGSLAIADTVCVEGGGRPWEGRRRQEGARGGERGTEVSGWTTHGPLFIVRPEAQARETPAEPWTRQPANQLFPERESGSQGMVRVEVSVRTRRFQWRTRSSQTDDRWLRRQQPVASSRLPRQTDIRRRCPGRPTLSVWNRTRGVVRVHSPAL